MATKAALSYLTATLTQGSADAFIQAQISTALSGQTKVCYRLRELLIQGPQAHGASVTQELSLTRKSFAAMPTALEKSLIHRWSRSASFTTSGLTMVESTIRLLWGEDDAPIIVEDPIYAQYDSATTSAASTIYIRLGYVTDSISEVDRLTLVANSLS